MGKLRKKKQQDSRAHLLEQFEFGNCQAVRTAAYFDGLFSRVACSSATCRSEVTIIRTNS